MGLRDDDDVCGYGVGKVCAFAPPHPVALFWRPEMTVVDGYVYVVLLLRRPCSAHVPQHWVFRGCPAQYGGASLVGVCRRECK